MKRIEWKKKHLKAFKMYLKGEKMEQIATKLNMGKTTLYRWEIRDNWKEFLDEQTKRLMEKAQMDILEEKERSLKLIKAAEGYWAKKLQEGDLKINFNDLSALQRAKWEIINPKNINQFNFMKQDNLNVTIDLPKLIEDTLNGEGR